MMSELGVYVRQWWTASGNFWQSAWDRVYNLCGRDDHNVAVWGIPGWVLIVFCTTHICFLTLDFLGRPRFLTKHKIQTRKNNPLQFKVLKSALPLVMVNLFLTPLPFIIMSPLLYKWRGMTSDGPLPTFPRLVLEVAIFILVDEIGFYYAHRLFHHPFFYKRIHKIHHEFTSPFSIISIYCHPVEHICANLFPPLLGPILLGSHLGVLFAYMAFIVVTPSFTHCGYSLSFPGIGFHDFHHLKFNVNYGVTGWLDRLHGTYAMYRNASEAERKDIKSVK